MNNNWGGQYSNGENYQYQDNEQDQYYTNTLPDQQSVEQSIRKSAQKGFTAFRIIWAIVCVFIFLAVNASLYKDSLATFLAIVYSVGALIVGYLMIWLFSLLSAIKAELEILNRKF